MIYLICFDFFIHRGFLWENIDQIVSFVFLIREASVAEDYEAGGGLVDDEDNDGWVVTHGRSKG